MAPAHFNQPMVVGAPVVLTFCADFRRTTLWAENRKATPGYDNFLSFLNAATDALLYCQTFCNLAEEEGLGTCFLGTTIYNPKAIIEALQLPSLSDACSPLSHSVGLQKIQPSPTAFLSTVSSTTRLTKTIPPTVSMLSIRQRSS